jgi:hypothetical protein
LATSPLTLFQAATSSAFPEDAEYIGQSQCKVCHNAKADGEQWNAWKTERHSHAFETLKSDAAKAVAEKAGIAGSPAEAAQCLKCHVTGYDEATQSAPAKIALADSVQCETCHGPGSMHQEDGKTLKFSPDKAAGIDVTAHLAKISEVTCTKCHNAESPTWNPEKYTTAAGEKVGFDFEQAVKIIAHPNPKKAQ